MFRRILVPLDGSTDGTAREEQALEAARRLAEREGAQLVLLHVDGDAGSSRAATRAELLDQVATLSRGGTEVIIHFAYGTTDDGIVSTAREEGADLIVLSPRQRPLLQTLLRPGVTAELLRHTPAPVLIWPAQLPGAQVDATFDAHGAPIIAPLDGSPEAERALPLAAAFAQAGQRPLLLVTVAAPLPAFAGMEMSYPGVALPTGVDQPEDRLREGLRYLGAVRRKLQADTPGLAVQTMGRMGQVAPTVADLAAAHPGCLVVMTTHGRGRALRLLLGSVATELLSLTPAPVFIVPPRSRSPRRNAAHVRVEAAQGMDADEGVLELAPDALGPRPTF